MVIEWEEKVESTRRMSLLAVHGSIGHGGWHREATLDDLRKACEAVGLVCVVDASGKYATDLDELRARAEEAEKAYADKVLELKDEREESAGKSMRADAELSNLRAQVAALRAPVAGEPKQADLVKAWEAISLDDYTNAGRAAVLAKQQWRAGHAAGLAQQPTAERATSAQLHAIADHVVETHEHDAESLPHAIADAVAARVRAERCLVTRAVEGRFDVYLTMIGKDKWGIRVANNDKSGCLTGDEDIRESAPADVPATLARMLGGGQ